MSERVGDHHVNNLGGVRWELYRCAVDRAHLEQAVTLFGQAVRATPAGSPDLPMRLANLAASLRDSFLETGIRRSWSVP